MQVVLLLALVVAVHGDCISHVVNPFWNLGQNGVFSNAAGGIPAVAVNKDFSPFDVLVTSDLGGQISCGGGPTTCLFSPSSFGGATYLGLRLHSTIGIWSSSNTQVVKINNLGPFQLFGEGGVEIQIPVPENEGNPVYLFVSWHDDFYGDNQNTFTIGLCGKNLTPCTAQWECQGVSDHYNFATCSAGFCRCLSNSRFVGFPDESSKCRCEAPNRVAYNSAGLAYCIAPNECLGDKNHLCELVSSSYNYAQCGDPTSGVNNCQCRPTFSGSATLTSPCSCPGTVLFNNGVVTCCTGTVVWGTDGSSSCSFE